MKIMITTKAKRLQMILLALSIVSALAVILLKVSPPWYGIERMNFLSGWGWGMRGIPIAIIMITIVLFNIGKKIPAVITSLFFTAMVVFATAYIVDMDDMSSLLILVIDALAVAITAVCLLGVFDRSSDYSASYFIESKESWMLMFFSGATILAYYLMNLVIQDFRGWFDGPDWLNFFGAFTSDQGELGILHAIIAVLMILVLYFAWKKQYKIFLGIDITLGFILAVTIIKHLDMPYRTVFFYFVLAMVIAETVLASLVFKSNLKPNLSKKKAELELLKSNGKISEEAYQKELSKLER